MPLYEYKGVGEGGKAAKGTIEADSPKSARLRLKQKGVFTTDLSEKKGDIGGAHEKKIIRIGSGRVKGKNLTLMVRQMATLIKARIPLDEALSALVEQTEDTKLKSIMSQIREAVNEGKSLADSMKMFPQAFSPLFVSMIRVGEASGNLDLVLVRLADFTESQQELRNKVVGAMAYPIFISIAGIGITIFLFAFAVPKITEVFEGSKMPLPMLTQVMIGISTFVSGYWLLMLLVTVGTFFALQFWLSTEKGKDWWDRVSLKIPVFGKLMRMIAVSRFARTMSTMIGSGVQLLDAIDIVKDVVGNSVLKRAIIKSRESISEGQTIAGPLKASGEFPPILTHMIAVGEKTGELEEMLNVVSDAYDSQVETNINSMTRLLEPLMILIMGGIIGLVALSIFLPMLQLNNLATQ